MLNLSYFFGTDNLVGLTRSHWTCGMSQWWGHCSPGLHPGNPLGVSVENCYSLSGFIKLPVLRSLSAFSFPLHTPPSSQRTTHV